MVATVGDPSYACHPEICWMYGWLMDKPDSCTWCNGVCIAWMGLSGVSGESMPTVVSSCLSHSLNSPQSTNRAPTPPMHRTGHRY